MNISKSDPRFGATKLSRREFIGDLTLLRDADNVEGYLDFLNTTEPVWLDLPVHPLIEPIDGFTLHYANTANDIDGFQVYLCLGSVVVGVYQSTVLTIDPVHRGKKLSRELVLAAYAQLPWKNKSRNVSERGRDAFESAYKFICNFP